jgi:hypothetical protein
MSAQIKMRNTQDVFRFSLKLGHRATRSALRICANNGRERVQQMFDNDIGQTPSPSSGRAALD